MPAEYAEVMDRLLAKHKAAAKFVPAPIVEKRPDAKVGIISMGGCDPAIREALDLLSHRGLPCDYMRIRAFPFPQEVTDFLMSHDVTYIVEQNRDAQLRTLLTIETDVPKDKMRSLLPYSGFPLSAQTVIEPLLKELGA